MILTNAERKVLRQRIPLNENDMPHVYGAVNQILAARAAAAPDALRERVEDELDAIWRESQGDRTIIRDAGIMQDIVRRLRAVLAEQ